MTAPNFGPWQASLSPHHRAMRLGQWQGLTSIILGTAAPLTMALRQAWLDEEALDRAAEELNKVPALPRRRLLALAAVLAGAVR
jgi:hypothetical protein